MKTLHPNYRTQHRFTLYHPAVTFGFFVVAVVLSMFTLHPYVLGISLLVAVLTAGVYLGLLTTLRTLLYTLPVALSIVVLNCLFNQRGATVLLSLPLPFHLPATLTVTRETLLFGLCSALMFSCVMCWFRLYQQLITTDRFLYLFSHLAPATALLIAMILRWVPLTTSRLAQIRAAHNLLGAWDTQKPAQRVGFAKLASSRQGTAIKPVPLRKHRIRTSLRQLGVLMSWSMEDAIQTADSMRARGYGAAGALRRTSFRSYRFTLRDIIASVYLAVTAVASVILLIASTHTLAFYPTLRGVGSLPPCAFLIVAATFALPLVIEGGDRIQWILTSLRPNPTPCPDRLPLSSR